MQRLPQGGAQGVDGDRRRVLADVGLALEEAMAALLGDRLDVLPEHQAAEQPGRVFGDVGHLEDAPEDGAQDDGHGDRPQQRPAQADDRAAVARAQVDLTSDIQK